MTINLQVQGRTVRGPTVAPRSDNEKVHWIIRNRVSYAGMNDRMERQFDVRSIDTGNGHFLITSTNIRVQVESLYNHFHPLRSMRPAQLNNWLNQVRQAKSDDDNLSYNQDTGALGAEATSMGYLGTEQHVVWALAASARTGAIIPPEFFIDNEGFGGTAGNGPQIEDGGYIGEMMSTIAMAHDTDWMIGRLFSVGPLAPLFPLTPFTQRMAIRMGSAGLFNAGQVTAASRMPGRGNMNYDDHPPNVFGMPWDEGFQRRARERDAIVERLDTNHDAIDAVLDFTAHGDRYYRNGLTSSFLRQGRHGWTVRYKVGFFAQFTDNEWLWDGNSSIQPGKNDVRTYNYQRTPYMPKR